MKVDPNQIYKLIVCKEEHADFKRIIVEKASEPFPLAKVVCLFSSADESENKIFAKLKSKYKNFDTIEYDINYTDEQLINFFSDKFEGAKLYWVSGNRKISDRIKSLSKFMIRRDEFINDFIDTETYVKNETPFPKFIGLTLTNKCNYRCFFCNREGNEKYNSINIENFYSLKPLIERAEIINLTGWGEPFMYEHIEEALEFINTHNNKNCISLTSNGSVITEELAMLLSKNINQLIISINAATKETYERDMKNGKWDKVIKNIRNARKYIPRNKMHFVFVGHKDNIHEFPEFVKLAAELDVWMVELLHIQITAVDFLRKSLWFAKEDTNKYIDEAIKVGKKLNVEVQARKFDNEYENIINRFECTAPFDQVYISETGDVAPCCYSGTQCMGTINFHGSFHNVWNGKKYGRLREEKYFPECSTCGNSNSLNRLETHINVLLRNDPKVYEQLSLVTVVVPSYNQASWLPRTLDSIINQTYPFWEAVVVDDGSTDNTWDVIQEYIRKDNRIRGIKKENGGISSALNRGIFEAKGKYFCWLSSDDLFNPDKLELQIQQFEKLDEDYGIIFGQFDFIDANDNVKELTQAKPFFDGLEFPQQLKYDMIDGCTVMLPMKVMRELNGFNEEFKHAQDTEFWFRLAAKGYKFFYLDKKLTKRRIHEQQGFTDFDLDCRYDGYWFVDFYLSNYSFRDFYNNINFNDESHRDIFIFHFLDMIIDPFCHINHPLVNEKFWNWFFDGLTTLNKETRKYLLDSLSELLELSFSEDPFEEKIKKIKIFSSKNNIRENTSILQYIESTLNFRKQVNRRIKNFSLQLKKIPPKKAKLLNNFADITSKERTNNSELLERYFNYGEEELKRNELLNAQSVFKYLADFHNPLSDKAFKKFIELSFLHSDYRKFINSFKRKNPIYTFPDKIKAYYIYSLLKFSEEKNKIDLILNSIKDKILYKKISSFINNTDVQNVFAHDILYWNYVVFPTKITHELKIKCQHCNNEIHKKFEFPLSSNSSSERFICVNCIAEFEFSDELLMKYFDIDSTQRKDSGRKNPKIAFIMRYTDIIGGGVSVAFKHMKWLKELGVEIDIYSNTEKPSWVELPGKFIQVKDHYEINEIDADAVIVFSVYDVPKIKRIFPSDKIYHLCQGYEGYHLGKTFKELRSDKYFYTTLHSLKVNNIVVSNHLKDLFKNKFGRISNYIPNGINLSIFRPKPEIEQIRNSLLFVGNPKDPLKGLQFLIDSLSKLQSSPYKVNDLKLFIVYGGNKLKGDMDYQKTSKLEIIFKRGLSPEEISDLMNSVSVVVNTSWYEGFTLPVLEAMACGTPSLSVDNMGVKSFAKNGLNSFVVDFGDHDSFNKILLELLRGSEKVNRIIHNGLETAKKYSLKKTLSIFIEEYSKILNHNFPLNKVDKFLSTITSEDNQLDVALNKKLSIKKINNEIILNKVSIVLVTFNQINYTLECIQSVKDYTKVDYEIIVVDNNSSDNTVEKLSKYPDIKLIQNKENLGFPNAVNIGIRAAAGKHILILNNDTVVTKGWLDRLIDVADSNERTGIVGPISNIVSGVQIDKNAKYNSIEEMQKYAEKVSKENKGQVEQFPRVAFLCTLIKREVIDKIGGLDERFSPGNFEDDDFCLRAQLAGFKTVIAKDVFIHHYGSKSFKANGEAVYAERMKINQQKFVDKWGADPNEIWLKGAKIKSRNIVYPVNNDEFMESFNRTLIHSEDNEFELALKEIERAITTYNESNRKGFEQISKEDLLNLAGNISLQLGHFEKSKEFFELELVENPNSGKACLGLAETFYKAELFDEAKTMYEWAIKNGENKNEIWNKLNCINQQLGLQENHNSLELSRENEIHSIQQAEELISKSDLLNAEKILLQILNSNPNNIDALNDYAVVHIMQNNFQPALEKINKVIQLDPSNEVALDNLKYIEQEVNSIN